MTRFHFKEVVAGGISPLLAMRLRGLFSKAANQSPQQGLHRYLARGLNHAEHMLLWLGLWLQSGAAWVFPPCIAAVHDGGT